MSLPTATARTDSPAIPRARRVAVRLMLLAPLALSPLAAHGYDYPTLERVRYVQQCMRDHPGPSFEMTSKCACVIDALAQQLPLEQYVEMTTAVNANSISGERGNAIRDTPALQADIKRYRELQAQAKKSCFIDVDAPR